MTTTGHGTGTAQVGVIPKRRQAQKRWRHAGVGRVNWEGESKVEPTGNSEPKSLLKSLLSTSSKMLVVPEPRPMCAITLCSWGSPEKERHVVNAVV